MGNLMKKHRGANPQPAVVGQPPVSQQVPVQQSVLPLQPHPVVIAAHLPPEAQNEPTPQQFSQPAMIVQEPQQPVMFAQEFQQPMMMPQQQPTMFAQEFQQPMMMNQPQQPAMFAPQQNFMTPIATQ